MEQLTSIRSMRPSFEQAKKALATGMVRIGCSFKEAMRPKMCFRCLDLGHMAKDCKNEDRRDSRRPRYKSTAETAKT